MIMPTQSTNRSLQYGVQNSHTHRLRLKHNSNLPGFDTSPIRRLRRPNSSFIEISSKVESGYRKFAPVTALNDPSFEDIGDTVKELHKIFELIFHNLQFFGQTFMDIAHLQIYLTNQEVISSVEGALNYHLRGHYPPINLTHKEQLPDGCTIQVIPTCFYIPPPSYQYQHLPDYQSIGNASYDALSYRKNPTSLYYNNSSQIGGSPQPIDNNQTTRMNSPLGDLLPRSIAISFGYYGNPSARLRSCMIYVTTFRAITSLIGLIDLALITSTYFFDQNLRLGSLMSTLRYFLTIGIITTAFSMILFFYGLIWLFHNSKNTQSDKVFLYSAPKWMMNYFKMFCQLGYYGDKMQMFLLVSSSSSLFTVSSLLNTPETMKLRHRFRASAGLGFCLFFIISILTIFSGLLLSVYKSMGFRLPVTLRENNGVSENVKKDELVKLLSNKDCGQSVPEHVSLDINQDIASSISRS